MTSHHLWRLAFIAVLLVVPWVLARAGTPGVQVDRLEPITTESAENVIPIAVLSSEAVDGESFEHIVLNAEGTLAATATTDGLIQLWDTVAGREALILEEPTLPGAWTLAFNAAGNELAAASPDGTLRVWNSNTGAVVQNTTSGGMVRSVNFSRAGVLYVIRCHDPAGFTPRFARVTAQAPRPRDLRIETVDVFVACSAHTDVNRDGTIAASAFYYAGTPIAIHNPPTSNASRIADHILEGGFPTVYDVDLSPRARRVAVGGEGRLVLFWDAFETNTPVRLTSATLDDLPGATYAVRFSPDESILADAGGDGDNASAAVIRLWNVNVDPPELLTLLERHTGAIKDLAFNADGTLLASAAEDGTIRFWGILSD